jgi:hypothetical protein
MYSRSHGLGILAALIAGWFLGGNTVPGVDPAAGIEIPLPLDILAGLKKDHPRLLVVKEDWDRLKIQVTNNPTLREWHGKLQRDAQRILEAPPSKYEIPDGLRLLSTSRRVLQRTQTLALLYQLDGNRSYVDRTWQELEAAAAFTNWNPRHFLDTAEMTHAFAIGYDWLYEVWTPEQREILRQAMIEKGLKPALNIYQQKSGWHKARHNWNQVCNGGIGMGALALGDEIPEMAGSLLQASMQSIQLAMAEFAPDGAWSEGPGYWNYATSYNVVFLAALQTALGTDFKLSQILGFAETGLFPMFCTSPIGRTFNYADGGDGRIRAPQMFWLARQFNRPAYARYERLNAAPQPLDLVWYDPHGEQAESGNLPLDKYFRTAEIALLRSEWENPQALFVGFKAGDNKANHSNLDLGSFVMDALGVRWAVDLGADDYNMPGYFGKQRWTYYRMRAEGHNTLVLNPSAEPDQNPAAAARIVRFASKPDKAFGIADLTPAYSSSAKQVRRGIALLNRAQVLVQDEIQAQQPEELWWFMHTAAEISLHEDKTVATLTRDNARLQARILAPSKAEFEVREARPLPSSPDPSMQNKNANIRKLAVHLNAVTEVRLAIELTPLRAGETAAASQVKLTKLEEW